MQNMLGPLTFDSKVMGSKAKDKTPVVMGTTKEHLNQNPAFLYELPGLKLWWRDM